MLPPDNRRWTVRHCRAGIPAGTALRNEIEEMTNMRLAFWMLASFALLLASPCLAADASDLKGLWLVTDYPAITARAGESTSVKLQLQNTGLAPESVALSVSDVPPGWTAVLLGGGSPVGAAMAATNESVTL